jgi:GMP synthase (glutamine-hydrolysing)
LIASHPTTGGMPRVLAVNNYPSRERFLRVKSSLAKNGAEVFAADWSEASESLFESFDAVVLSGSPDMMSTSRAQRKFEREVDAVRDASVPVLGICFGHQLVAHAFGAKVVKDRRHVLGFVKTSPLDRQPLFEGLAPPVMLLESRWEVVKSLPAGFDLLATSEATDVAAMKHARRPIYGVQSHPERSTRANPEGDMLVRNFIAGLG